jgi:dienelactone hydrolase
MPKPTIVLVHGAWADGSSWNAVSTALQGRGYTVLTPTNLLRGVAGDAAYVASYLKQRTTGPAVQHRMAERAGSTVTEVAGSHVSMVSHPDAAIAAILAAAATVED